MRRYYGALVMLWLLTGWLSQADERLPMHLNELATVQAAREHDLERDIKFPELVRGNPTTPKIALTFDDGPHLKFTEKLLQILRQEQVPATFFVVGKQVDAYPWLVREEAAAGHEVANHTYHHLRLRSLPPAQIEAELRDGDAAIQRALGSPTRLYRPPGGEYDKDVLDATKRLGMVMVLWTDDPGDFERPDSAVIESRLLGHVRDGGIILLHDGIPQTMDMLPDLIHKLRDRGMTFVTVSQMAREGGVRKTHGPMVPLRELTRSGS